MSKILNIKIDVNKLEKPRFFKGEKGTYADISVFLNDEPDQYGNHGMVTQDISKEERESGLKAPILGNVRRVHDLSPSVGTAPKVEPQEVKESPYITDVSEIDESELPF